MLTRLSLTVTWSRVSWPLLRTAPPELGDGTIIGAPGWGTDELEYYTSSPLNASTDGAGHLVLTTRKTDPGTTLTCYYGPCAYTSARLATAKKAEFAYGRIESRILVPRGAGLWPAFWSLGTDTFTPERWHFVVEHARWSRQWLADLPPAVAERIAWKNGEALFGSMLTPRAP